MGGFIDGLRRAEWFDAERARVYPCLLAACWAAVLVVSFRLSLRGAPSDFPAFWAAGRLAWTDPLLAWSYPHLHALQHFTSPTAWVPFVNPPPFLFLVAPLGLLPLPAAQLVWLAATLAFYFAAGRRFLSVAVLAGSPIVYINGSYAQNGFLTVAILMAGVGQLGRRPFVAGLILGALVIKPQLAVLLPVALIGGRCWRAVAGAASSSLGLLALSAIAFGPASFSAFLAATGLSREVLASGMHAFKMQTAFAFVLALGGGVTAAIVAQAVATCASAVAVYWTWRGPSDTFAKSAMLAALIPLATPYLYVYDLGVWLIPLSWLAAEGARKGFLPWERLTIGLLFMAPLVLTFAMWASVNIAPLVTLAVAACVYRRLRPLTRGVDGLPVLGAAMT